MSQLKYKQPSGVTCPSHWDEVNNITGRRKNTDSGSGGRLCVCVDLTVKPMPTVEVNDPGMNLPWSNWTSREVLPTPLSPTRMVCRLRHTHTRAQETSCSAALRCFNRPRPQRCVGMRSGLLYEFIMCCSAPLSDALRQLEVGSVSSGGKVGVDTKAGPASQWAGGSERKKSPQGEHGEVLLRCPSALCMFRSVQKFHRSMISFQTFWESHRGGFKL